MDERNVAQQDDLQRQNTQLREQLRFLEEQLMHAQRLITLGELASTTTHEFNNILTTVINYARLGLRHKDEPTRNRSFEKILSASTRAAKIVGTILGAAKNRKNAFDEVDLVTLVEDALLLLEREMTKYRIAVEKNYAEVPPILADGNQVQQILLNLLINARQAMSEGGRLVVKISLDKENSTVDLMIRDYGSGIPSEKLPFIFDSFYSTKTGPDSSGKGGSGLGLALCKKVMEEHKGKIRVESALGKGTAFTLKFPLASTGGTFSTNSSPSIPSTLAPDSGSLYTGEALPFTR